MNLVLHINGGLGKTIMATAIVRSYKALFPESKIVVVSGYPEVFLNNPDVYKNFGFNVPYLWQEYYGNPQWQVFAADPYMHQDWIKNEPKHLIRLWCEMMGIPCTQETPLLHFSSAEFDELQTMIKVDKPILVVQSTGGSNPAARSWTRNPPMDEFDVFLRGFYDSHYVVHLCVPETPVLQNVHQRVDNMSRRQAMALIYFASSFVGIDSFGLHARAANPNPPGYSYIFFPLAESIKKLGYVRVLMTNVEPTYEVQDMIRNHQDYYATVFQHNIESLSESCPVPVGKRWFNLNPEAF